MDDLIKNTDEGLGTSNAFAILCSLTHASESMKHELHALFLYLASCGENPDDFVLRLLQKQTFLQSPPRPVPSGIPAEKTVSYHPCEADNPSVQPELQDMNEENRSLNDFQCIPLKKPLARQLFSDFREAVKSVLPEAASDNSGLQAINNKAYISDSDVTAKNIPGQLPVDDNSSQNEGLYEIASKQISDTEKTAENKQHFFEKIYIENRALPYPLTQRILAAFPSSDRVHIAHYKDVFNVGGQDFAAQKQAPALILAVNDGHRLYPGARPCQDFGHEHFYYTSQVKNCLYDCEYCFLRGMYPSGNIVVFVNLEDYFEDVDKELENHPVYLSIAYDTDLLALEGITGICERWAEFAAKRPELLLEIRTKCGSTGFVQKLAENIAPATVPKAVMADSPTAKTSESQTKTTKIQVDLLNGQAQTTNLQASTNHRNIILAYTISPPAVSETFEHGAGSYEARKKALYFALSNGLRTRLCIDPALAVKDFKKLYCEMIDDLFSYPAVQKLEDISIGSFRISGSYIKRMKKTALTPISAYPYSLKDGMCGYDEALRSEMLDFLENKLTEYYPGEKIFRADF